MKRLNNENFLSIFFTNIIVLTEELSHFKTLKLICIKMVNFII